MISIVDAVDHLNEIYSSETLANFDHLAKKSTNQSNSWDFFQSPLMGDNITKSIFGGSGALTEDPFLQDDLFVTADKEYNSYKDIT